MKNTWTIGAFLVGLFVLQISFIPLISRYGTGPDLMILVTVAYAFIRGSQFGGFVGLLLGLLTDIATGSYFGMHTMIYFLLGNICGIFSDHMYKEQIFFPILLAVLASVGSHFLCLCIVYALGYKFSILTHVISVLPFFLLYQLIFSYPVYWATYIMNKRTIPVGN